jgi:hypothetical protein
MDDHNSHSEKICRICANRISKKNKKTVSTALEFKGLIHRTFQYDINTDDENVHPKNLCIPCKDKLRSVVEPATASLPIAAFNPHQEDDCPVCRSVHPKAKRRESFRFIQLEEYVSTAEHRYSAPSLISPPETVMLDDIVKIVDSSAAYILLESTTNELTFGRITGVKKGVVDLYVNITSSMNWVVRVLDGVISASLPLLQDIPKLLTLADVQLLISRLESVQICEGNADFHSIVDKKFLKGEDLCFLNAEGEARSYIEDEFLKRASDSNIIRSSDCEKLISSTAHGSNRCLPCSKERKILHSKHGKEKLMKDSDTHSPNVPNMSLSRESLLAKTSALAQTKKLLSQKIKRLQARIQVT